MFTEACTREFFFFKETFMKGIVTINKISFMCSSEVCQPELLTLEHVGEMKFPPTSVSLVFGIFSDAE